MLAYLLDRVYGFFNIIDFRVQRKHGQAKNVDS